MIGKNDDGAIINLQDMEALLAFAKSKPYVVHLAFWAVHRDKPGNAIDSSAGISGFSQGAYTNLFKKYAP